MHTCKVYTVPEESNPYAFLFIEAKSPDEYATIDKDKTIEEQLYKVSFMENAEGDQNNVSFML